MIHVSIKERTGAPLQRGRRGLIRCTTCGSVALWDGNSATATLVWSQRPHADAGDRIAVHEDHFTQWEGELTLRTREPDFAGPDSAPNLGSIVDMPFRPTTDEAA